jgi:PAS domain S-box-containing protein
MLCVSLYSVGAGIRAASGTLSLYRIGTIVKYAGILGLGPTQFWFGLTYTNRTAFFTRRRWALLLAWPVGIFLLVLTAPAHDLLWSVEGLVRGPPAATIDRVDGPLVSLNFIYQFVLILATYVLIALVGLNRGGRYRRQVVLMLAGGTIPFAGAVVLLANGNPAAALDPTAFAYTITGIVFAIALFRYDFLDLVPVARHTLVDAMSDPVFVVDDDGRIVDVNAAGSALLDDEGDDLIGRAAAEVIPSYESRENGSEADTDVTIETDGRVRFFDTNRTTLTDGSGTEIGSLLIYRDVTERRSVEERFKRLTEQASDMVSVLDADGTITYTSQSVADILGYEPTELTGENVMEYVHPDDRAKLVTELTEHADDYGYTNMYTVRFRNSAGEFRIIEARARNLLDDPFVDGIVLNTRDITEKQQQKQKLERQNERLDQFASIVSHDLRNPLNVATGHLDLLDADLETEETDSIDVIQRQLDRMEDIIDDSLTLARSGETVTDTGTVDLEAIARDAWANVDTREATLVVEQSMHLDGDRNRLLNVFENLFRNSVEHNESTDLTVRIGHLPDDSGFFVEDTGTGVADDGANVFEQGYSTSEDGTGFGLAIVQDIVKAHGWTISLAESDEGGARFEIECTEIPVGAGAGMA